MTCGEREVEVERGNEVKKQRERQRERKKLPEGELRQTTLFRWTARTECGEEDNREERRSSKSGWRRNPSPLTSTRSPPWSQRHFETNLKDSERAMALLLEDWWACEILYHEAKGAALQQIISRQRGSGHWFLWALRRHVLLYFDSPSSVQVAGLFERLGSAETEGAAVGSLEETRDKELAVGWVARLKSKSGRGWVTEGGGKSGVWARSQNHERVQPSKGGAVLGMRLIGKQLFRPSCLLQFLEFLRSSWISLHDGMKIYLLVSDDLKIHFSLKK
jgi:hypothetical protein